VLYTSAIALGVAALVAINSFRMNVADAVHRESRTLLGADLELRAGQAFPTAIQSLLDSVSAAGTPVSYVTNFNSMALANSSGLTRLASVRAVAGAFPYYGTIETDPPSRWLDMQEDRRALVDPALLVQLDAAVGDTLAIGEARFVIFGTLGRIPGEIGFETAFGPRIYIPAAFVEETGLLRFGSRVRYRAYLKLDDRTGVESFLEQHEPLLTEHDIGYDTFTEREEDFAEVLDALSRFLGLVGLIALLLGGIAVASAVHVFVKSKLATVAVLRCLGATQRIVFAVYLLQAAALGFIGSAMGVVLGLAVQAYLPGLLEDFLPLEVRATVHWPTVLAGLGIGVWVALAFALLPLLQVRGVSPLQALRHEFNGPTHSTRLRYAAIAVLGASVVGLTLWQAPVWQAGVAFAGALGIGTAILWLTAWGLTRLTRRLFPRRARYVIRQGVANLYRPHNQTVAVILAVGAGVFLIATLYIVQHNLLDQIALDRSPSRPNVVVFEVQQDQRAGVEALVHARKLPLLSVTPIVSARLARLGGRSVDELLADTVGNRSSRWPLTREYRHTYRDSLVLSEELVAGRWWDDDAPDLADVSGSGLARISVEEGLAAELGVDVGDRITWDVQGVQIETEIASLRRVEWARLEPNFFVVFEPEVLEEAPQTVVVLTRAQTPLQRAELQRDLVRAYPNIVAADLTVVQETIDSVIDSVTVAIRFMAFFSIASGLIVLVGSIATSRFQRARETVLLKTLGARARQISQMLFTEYAVLGTLAGFTGILLSSLAGWALVTFLFELDFRLPALRLVGIWGVTTAITVAVGLLNSRDVLRKAPLAVLRQMGD
jgi:putative ABC transport system permease protein